MSDVDTLLQTYQDILDYCHQHRKGDAMVTWAAVAIVKLKELQTRVAELEERLRSEQARVRDLQVIHTEAYERSRPTELELLQVERDALTARVAELDETLFLTRISNDALRERAFEAEARVAELERQHTDDDVRFALHLNRAMAAEEKSALAEMRAIGQKAHIEAVEAKVAELREALSGHRDLDQTYALTDAEKRIAELQARVAELETRLNPPCPDPGIDAFYLEADDAALEAARKEIP